MEELILSQQSLIIFSSLPRMKLCQISPISVGLSTDVIVQVFFQLPYGRDFMGAACLSYIDDCLLPGVLVLWLLWSVHPSCDVLSRRCCVVLISAGAWYLLVSCSPHFDQLWPFCKGLHLLQEVSLKMSDSSTETSLIYMKPCLKNQPTYQPSTTVETKQKEMKRKTLLVPTELCLLLDSVECSVLD